jgi:hypothetical protein
LVRIGANGPVYNAPIVASGDSPHDIAGHGDVLDRVVAIDTKDPHTATVTTFPAPNNGPSGYSPMWSVYPAVWTKAATSAGKETLVTSSGDVQKFAGAGLITTPDGKAFGAAGITVNCPVIAFAEKRP